MHGRGSFSCSGHKVNPHLDVLPNRKLEGGADGAGLIAFPSEKTVRASDLQLAALCGDNFVTGAAIVVGCYNPRDWVKEAESCRLVLMPV